MQHVSLQNREYESAIFYFANARFMSLDEKVWLRFGSGDMYLMKPADWRAVLEVTSSHSILISLKNS